MPFFRQFQHLLPKAKVWRLPVGSTIRKFFQGLSGFGSDVREYADDVFDDANPTLTRELPEWQKQFGLYPVGSDADQRLALASAWQQQGGQSPHYLQDAVRAAGFDVYLHEWWTGTSFTQVCCHDDLAECGEPSAQCGGGNITRFVRNPLDYTDQPLIGTVQCGNAPPTSSTPIPAPFAIAQCGEPNARCNRFLANDPDYLVNLDFSNNAPPPIPNDPTKWVFFHYWGAATFPNRAEVDADRQAEFERLILKLRPANNWIVTLIDYV